MRKKIFLFTIILIIFIGLGQVIPAIAGESPDNSSKNGSNEISLNNLRFERHLIQNKEQLASLTKHYELLLKDGNFEKIQLEIQDSLIQEKAKELGISTNGGSLDQLELDFRDAVGDSGEEKKVFSISDYRLERSRQKTIIKKASEFGIETENKTVEKIQQEILNQLLIEKAIELGINVEDTDVETIKSKLKETIDNR